MAGRAVRSFEERFWSFVDRRGADECWPWLGTIVSGPGGGYGHFSRPGAAQGMLRAHRVSWELHHKKPVPRGLKVLHSCDNRACVNPNHLWTGTHDQNMADMVAKGRAVTAHGEAHKLAKLLPDDVHAIRVMAARGEKQREIATVFGIHQSRVSAIVRRKAWAHLQEAA